MRNQHCCCSDIEALWRIAGERYVAHPQDIQNTVGPDFSMWDAFPDEPGKVVFPSPHAIRMLSEHYSFSMHHSNCIMCRSRFLKARPLCRC